MLSLSVSSMAFNGPMAVPAQAVRMPKISMQETEAPAKKSEPAGALVDFSTAAATVRIASFGTHPRASFRARSAHIRLPSQS